MGEAHRKAEGREELRRRDAQTYLANRSQSLSEQRRVQSERQLGIEESLLGTDAQVNGQLGGVSADVLPYLGRYQFDTNAAQLRISGWDNSKLGDRGVNLQGRTDAANALLQQAEDAARSGNFALAEQLKSQAKASLTSDSKKFGALGGIEGIDQIWSLVEDPSMAARTRLGSPQAQLIGRQLQEARSFQDFNSAASINERQLLSEGGERAIAAGSRDAMRQNRAGALGSGAAQSPYARQMANERMDRAVGQDKAQLFAGVAQQFQEMQRKYGKDTVAFANDWLQGTSGMRESYQAGLDQIKANFSQLATQFAQMNQDMSQFQFQRGDAEKARSDARTQYYQDLIVGISGAVLGGMMSASNNPGLKAAGENLASVTGSRRGMPAPQQKKQPSSLGGSDALMSILGGGIPGF